jgi:hypothetical protein
MMPLRRDLRPLVAIAVLGVAIALAETVTGLDGGLLLLSPALALLAPLLAGRYVGEDALGRLVARRWPPQRRVRVASTPLPRRRPRVAMVRGGQLLAVALAQRGPPLTVA